jgi:hypothetical protein
VVQLKAGFQSFVRLGGLASTSVDLEHVEPRLLNRGDLLEGVFAAVIGADESVALLSVEPFY